MNKKLKIAIAVGATLALGVGGLLAYRKFSKRDESARLYLKEVDENGGEAPIKVKSKGFPLTSRSNSMLQKMTSPADKSPSGSQLYKDSIS